VKEDLDVELTTPANHQRGGRAREKGGGKGRKKGEGEKKRETVRPERASAQILLLAERENREKKKEKEEKGERILRNGVGMPSAALISPSATMGKSKKGKRGKRKGGQEFYQILLSFTLGRKREERGGKEERLEIDRGTFLSLPKPPPSFQKGGGGGGGEKRGEKRKKKEEKERKVAFLHSFPLGGGRGRGGKGKREGRASHRNRNAANCGAIRGRKGGGEGKEKREEEERKEGTPSWPASGKRGGEGGGGGERGTGEGVLALKGLLVSAHYREGGQRGKKGGRKERKKLDCWPLCFSLRRGEKGGRKKKRGGRRKEKGKGSTNVLPTPLLRRREIGEKGERKKGKKRETEGAQEAAICPIRSNPCPFYTFLTQEEGGEGEKKRRGGKKEEGRGEEELALTATTSNL